MGIYYLMMFAFMGLSWYVGHQLKSRFREYSTLPIGLTGAQVAQKMLQDNGITDVQVISTPGALTDHYNPENKTVNLSDWVYAQNTVAAAAVAAHECGHAVQHAQAYQWLTMRSKLVPAVSLSSRLMPFILMGGLLVMASSGNPIILMIGIALFAVTTIFTVVTLPVEFDASNRALKWLDSTGIMSQQYHEKAKDALKWAAMTYVVAALASIAQLLYYISLLSGRRED